MSYLNKALILKPSTISKKHWFLLNKLNLLILMIHLTVPLSLPFQTRRVSKVQVSSTVIPQHCLESPFMWVKNLLFPISYTTNESKANFKVRIFQQNLISCEAFGFDLPVSYIHSSKLWQLVTFIKNCHLNRKETGFQIIKP